MLDEELKRAGKNKKSRATAYRIKPSSGFVKARAMSVGKMNRRLRDGIHSLGALMQMLREAAISAGGEVTSAAPTMEDWGVSFTLGNGLYWTGLSYSESEILFLRVFGVNRNRALEIGFGSVQPWIPNSYAWWNRLDLESERVRFFAKTESNQIECIEQFLTESIGASTPALGQAQNTA
jgi:hypothetical protein